MPNQLESYATRVETLRDEIFDSFDETNLPPFAEQEIVSALAFLVLAQSAFFRAHYHEMRNE